MKIEMKKIVSIAVLSGVVACASVARADMKEIKLYKEVYPDAKVKCINCHAVALPKKEDGAHDPSAYGKAVLEQAAKDATALPTVDTYKKVGSIEDFNANLDSGKK